MSDAMRDVGYPRLERNADGRPIWNQGPYGMSAILAVSYPFLPERWPADWPEDGVIAGDDSWVRRFYAER